ncbi:MAG: SMR family transporter [Actinomycetota bacterium]
MRWALLAVGIGLEITSSVSLKLSEGLRRPGPTVTAVAATIAGLLVFMLVVDRFSLSYAYAVWAGLGTLVVATIGIAAFDEPVSALKVISLVIIASGLVGLNLAGAE